MACSQQREEHLNATVDEGNCVCYVITYTAVLVVMLMLAFLNDPTNSVSGRIYHTVLLRTDGALPLLLALLSDKYTSLRIMVRKHGVLPTVYNMDAGVCLLTASRCISGLVMLWDTNPHQRPPQP